MQVFQNFTDVHAYLNGLMSETRSRTHAYTLDNMQRLMNFLGNPQDTYKTIHVAGTSGKSSTCHYLSEMLKSGGQKVGLSVSPHVYQVNERVQIGTKPLAEKKFCKELGLFVEQVEKSGVRPTYFELLVAFAFWEFARQKVDYAVIEVGLGGLLDGTNVISRSDKICVVTDIGLDHTSTLGKTLTAIAAQKAGIILPTNTVFSYDQDEAIMRILREVCDQQKAKLHEVWPLKSVELPDNLPLFQRRNWYLALAVYNHLTERDNLPSMSESELALTTMIYIPARMERVRFHGKTIILDAAHNPQKLDMLVKSIKHAYPKQSVACMVSFVRAKQTKIRDNLEMLLPAVSHVIATDFGLQNKDRLATDPLTIVKHCDELGYQNWEMIPEPGQALQALLSRDEDILLVAGSFFLPDTIRPLLVERA